jgi:hypothetical protein
LEQEVKMGELEASVGRMKGDFQKHDMNGAWQEFQKEILQIERQPNSKAEKAQQEAAYLVQVIKECDDLKKLGFPSAKFHQNGRSLEFFPNDTDRNVRWGTANLSFTAFTDTNSNKKSHDLTVDEAKTLLPQDQGKDGMLHGKVQDSGISQPEKSKSPYAAGVDATSDSIAKSDQTYRPAPVQEAVDQTIGWNNWAHGIQSTLQQAVAGEQFLLDRTQRNGSLQFDFTVDAKGNIYNAKVYDSNGNAQVSQECARLANCLGHTNVLNFPGGTQYRTMPFHWTLPYGPDVMNGQNYQNVPDEHHRIPVKSY